MHRLVFAAWLLASSFAAAQTDFSADIVNLAHANNPFQTKIYATKGKLRFQGIDKAGRVNSIMIVNLATRHSIVLLPQQKLFVEQSQPQIPGQGVTFFQPKDVENACAEWQKLSGSEVKKCHKVAHESVTGRDTVKYESTLSKDEASSIWLDTKLHFPVKWQSPVGAGELQNIQEAAQPADLFEIPSGYTRRSFAPPAPEKPRQ